MHLEEIDLIRAALIHALEDQAASRLENKKMAAENAKIEAEGHFYFRTIQWVMLACVVAAGAAFVATMIELIFR